MRVVDIYSEIPTFFDISTKRNTMMTKSAMKNALYMFALKTYLPYGKHLNYPTYVVNNFNNTSITFLNSSVFIQCVHAHILRLPCLTYGNFSIVKNESRLNSNVLETFNDLSEDECENKCIKHRLCKSINTKKSTGVNCELISKSTEDPFDSVVPTAMAGSGWRYTTTDYKEGNIGPYCEKKDPCPAFFGIACMDICSCPGYICQKNTLTVFKHCQEAYTQGYRFTRVYPIHVARTLFFSVRCDMETNGGGWIVFQRRVDASVDFYLNWNEYKTGFGDLNLNFWLGLEKIHNLAGPGKGAILRVDLKHMSNPDEVVYAEYNTFEISGKIAGYKLTIGGYSGTAGNSLSYHNNMQFSTKDRGQTTYCARRHQGAWWYNGCHNSNLNGLFPTSSSKDSKYMSWYRLHNEHGGIIFSEMKISI